LATIFYKFPLPSTVLLVPFPFSIGGLTSVKEGLTFSNLIKTPPIYSAS